MAHDPDRTRAQRAIPQPPSTADMELTRPHRVAYVDGVRMGIIATGIAGRYTGPTRRRFWLCDLNARKVLHGPYDRLSKAHKALDGLLMGTGDSGNVPGRLLARLLLG